MMRRNDDPPDESDGYPDDGYDEQPYYRKSYDVWLSRQLILDPGDPLDSARQFLMVKYSVRGVRTLNRLQAEFYAYDGICYQPIEDEKIRAQLYDFLDGALRWDPESSNYVPFKPTKTKVSSVVDALRALTLITRDQSPPMWIDRRPEDPIPNELLCCRNGLLHLLTRETYPSSPRFFTTNAIDFDYDAAAPTPSRWLQFLDEVWGDDQESKDALQDYMGYSLTPDTRQQKMLLMVGPKRSGKGSATRVLEQLIGRQSVCNPTLSSLCTQFGVQTLIGKSVAVISDARFSARGDMAAVAERLLSISGEDKQTVPQKYKPDWCGYLKVRFVILSNELPQIVDMSGALASRFIVLTMTKSFYGKEDTTLSDQLRLELPGILLWAHKGWLRLHERGHFKQPQSSEDAIRQLEDLGSPMNAFLRECCAVEADGEVSTSTLYDKWRVWCSENGYADLGSVQLFGRNLRAALPRLRIVQKRLVGVPVRLYRGIRLTGGS
jgi:putative DNA primase/helicase